MSEIVEPIFTRSPTGCLKTGAAGVLPPTGGERFLTLPLEIKRNFLVCPKLANRSLRAGGNFAIVFCNRWYTVLKNTTVGLVGIIPMALFDVSHIYCSQPPAPLCARDRELDLERRTLQLRASRAII